MIIGKNLLLFLTSFMFTLCLSIQAFDCLSNTSYSAQVTENCVNGIDDDGDGLIDCFDPDCACVDACIDHYYNGCEIDCEYLPNCESIEVETFWVSEGNTGNYPVLVAGDIDADGVPEVIACQTTLDTIHIIDGQTGISEVMIVSPVSLMGGMAPAIGDIDHDGYGEIILVGNDRYIYCYEHTGNLKYVTSDTVGYDQGYRWSVVNLADVNYDGEAEIIIGNQIFESTTGILLAQGGTDLAIGYHPARDETWFNLSFASPVIADALPDDFCPNCQGLELIAGNQVLSIDLANNSVNLEIEIASQYSDGYTSIADFDMDGDLDAIIQGKVDTQNTVYIWDLQTTEIMREFPLWTNTSDGASRVNVTDLDGDGAPEISFVSKPYFYALDNDFSLMWSDSITDMSGITVSTVFDFCGNGSVDVIYRDQENLYIYDGPTGDVKLQFPCISSTHIEMPIILDVDADGQTEILFTCGPSHLDGNVVALKSAGEPWASSRKVWNQHAYFNTNINDDLSIPMQQQNPHIVGDSLVMNTFLNQFSSAPFPAADAQLNFEIIECMGDSISLNLEVCNLGDNLLSFQTPVSFYDNNPTTSSPNWLGLFNINETLDLDSCINFSLTFPIPLTGVLYAVGNDDHSIPTPYNLGNNFPITPIAECNFLNNIDSVIIGNGQVVLEIDTSICENESIVIAGMELFPNTNTLINFSGNNGCDSLVLFNVYPLDSAFISEEYTICYGDSIFIFDTYQTEPGIYTMDDIALSGCDSIIEITLNVFDPIQLNFDTEAACPDDNTGVASVIATGGQPPFSYLWNTNMDTPLIENLNSGFYEITVTDSFGCTQIGLIEVLNNFTQLPITLSVPVSCYGYEDGIIELQGGSNDLTYSLDGISFQTDSIFGNLPEGEHVLYAMDSFGCVYELESYIDSPIEVLVQLPEDITINLGDSLIIHSATNDILFDTLSFEWTPNDYLNCSFCPDPLALPLESTTYTLTVVNENGCFGSDDILITILKDRNVYIPNAFSPNFDGTNDVFMIYSDQSVSRVLNFKLFDRWGELVFADSDFYPNNPIHGWDGVFLGEQMGSGVFAYLAEIEFVDGVIILYKGDFTLLK